MQQIKKAALGVAFNEINHARDELQHGEKNGKPDGIIYKTDGKTITRSVHWNPKIEGIHRAKEDAVEAQPVFW